MDASCRLGVAIAAFNSADVIRGCLQPLRGLDADVVLFDDGSSDGTAEIARQVRPDIVILHGDGNQWWTGGTNAAIEECLKRGADYVLLLNPDVRIDRRGVEQLVEYAQGTVLTVVAAMVVDDRDTDRIAWAGSRFGRVVPGLPVYASRFVAKSGTLVSDLPETPYEVDDAHGRGVLVPRTVIEAIGLPDATRFPHYGADIDYFFRARKAGAKIVVYPGVRARLLVDHTGLRAPDSRTVKGRVVNIWNYLFARKHGDAVRMWWRLYWAHLKPHQAVASYAFVLAVNVFRKMTR
ncbi:MAG: glycosyltransferase family 2 protein [Deltaproteobacteria bacterium]|nr:glycosyltransferase family 2 protein [Deltaproteobacteria bacterium]